MNFSRQCTGLAVLTKHAVSRGRTHKNMTTKTKSNGMDGGKPMPDIYNTSLPGGGKSRLIALVDELKRGNRQKNEKAEAGAIAMIQVILEICPDCESGFLCELTRQTWGDDFPGLAGMAGMIPRLRENPDNYPARHRANVAKLRPMFARMIEISLKDQLRRARKIAK